MNDEQFFLANAYLDGELTAAERAIAETDPVVMAAVEELRVLQDLVRDVGPPADAVRDSAIAAAMAQFAAANPAPATRRTAPPVPFRSRPSYTKYLAVAAGVLGVGLFGVAVANLGTGDDDQSADLGGEPADEPATEPATAESSVMEADDTFGAERADDAGTAEVPAAEEPADEPAMDAADEPASEPAEEPASEQADEQADEPAAATQERPSLEPGQVLTTPEELGSFGTGLLEQRDAGTLPPSPNHACPIDDVLGRSEYLADGMVVPVLVAVDEPAGVVLAFADETCEFVVEGPLYRP